jgi:hypothetical protein
MVTISHIEDDSDGDVVGMDAVHPAIAGVITSSMLPPSMRPKVPVVRYAGSLESWLIEEVSDRYETSHASARAGLYLACAERKQFPVWRLYRARDSCPEHIAQGLVFSVGESVEFLSQR